MDVSGPVPPTGGSTDMAAPACRGSLGTLRPRLSRGFALKQWTFFYFDPTNKKTASSRKATFAFEHLLATRPAWRVSRRSPEALRPWLSRRFALSSSASLPSRSSGGRQRKRLSMMLNRGANLLSLLRARNPSIKTSERFKRERRLDGHERATNVADRPHP
jgi:hypothetical protein